MISSCEFLYCHDDLDPSRPYLGAFETEAARVLIQPHRALWLLHWYANSASALLLAIQRAVRDANLKAVTLQIEFVPPDFELEMLNAGWRHAGEFVEAEIEDLQAAHKLPTLHFPVRTMLANEIMVAARITEACRGQTRGYYGEHPEWIERFAADPNQKVWMAVDGSRPVGVMFAGLFGFDHPRGPVCWIRDMAVLPSFQNRGVGQEMLLTALHWGLQNSAKRATLAVDVQNDKAIHLYQSAGFHLKPGRGQINLRCDFS